MTTVEEKTCDRIIGQVKWFNNKVGYGFITVNDGELSGKDIFIHYSAIHVTDSQYKYLVQGEYVEFTLVKSTAGAHEFQAVDISGIKGGVLMCEMRRNNRPARENSDESTRSSHSSHSVPYDNNGTAPPQRRYIMNRQTGGRGQSGRGGRGQADTRDQSTSLVDGVPDSAGEFTSVRRRNPKRKETVEVATA